MGYLTAVRSCHLSSIRGIFLRTSETHLTGRSPRNNLAAGVGNRDDDVIKGSTDVHLAHLLHYDKPLFGFVFSFLCHLVIAKNAAGVGEPYPSISEECVGLTDCRYSLFRCFLLAGHGLTLTLTSARIIFGTLATYGQTFAVTQAAIAANVHQTLNVKLNF